MSTLTSFLGRPNFDWEIILQDILENGTFSAPTGGGTALSLTYGTLKFNLVGSGLAISGPRTISAGSITGFSIVDGSQTILTMTGLLLPTFGHLQTLINGSAGIDPYGEPFKALFAPFFLNEALSATGSGDGESLLGSSGIDNINSGGGDDYVRGGSGVDTLNGGTGNDFLDYFSDVRTVGININLLTNTVVNNNAGAATVDIISGFESIGGTSFSDILRGNDENSVLIGNGGGDTFFGNMGDNYYRGGSGVDTFNGGTGTGDGQFDKVSYETETDGIGINATFNGGGNVTIVDTYGFTDTGTSIEQIKGSQFADIFTGSIGNDRAEGMAGNDIFNLDSGEDYVEYRNETDAGTTQGVIVNLSSATIQATLNNGLETVLAGKARDSFGYTDTLIDVESIFGTKFNDYIVGSSADNNLSGDRGSDTIYGGDGSDNIRGDEGGADAGADQLYGEAGDDSFKGGAGADLIDGGADRDRIEYNLETTFTGDDATHGVIVNLSTVALTNVTVTGIPTTTVAAGTAIDTRNYVDTLVSIEDVQGTGYNDIIVGNGDDNYLEGYEGNDKLYGGAGNDNLRGDDGGPTPGNDQLYGEAGDDSFKGGAGADLIDGGADRDRVEYNLETTFTGDDATHGVIVNLSTVALTNVTVTGIPTTTVAAGTAIDTRNYVDTLVDIEDVQGTGYNDILVGNGARNRLEGDEGNDSVTGGAGGDDLFGGDGTDTVSGGSDNDFVVGGAGIDNLDGGTGGDDYDTAGYSFEYLWARGTQGIFFNMSGMTQSGILTGTARDSYGDIDTVANFEEVHGTGFNDTVYANVLINEQFHFKGFNGNDTFVGTATGRDRIVYVDDERWALDVQNARGITLTPSGITVNFAGDTVAGDGASGTIIDSFGDTDTVSGVDVVRATFFVDTFNGGADDEEFQGLKGADIINGGAGFDEAAYYNDKQSNDVQAGGTAGITVNFSGDTNANGISVGTVVDGFGDTDQLTNIEAINGTEFDDVFTGGADAVEFWSGNGADTYNTSTADGYFDGGDGTDKIVFNSAMADHIVTYDAGSNLYRFFGNDGSIRSSRDVEQFQFSDGLRTAAQLVVTSGAPVRTANIAAVTGTAAEGNGVTTSFTFTVTLNAAAYDNYNLTYTIAGFGANPTNATDFVGPLTGTVNINQHDITKTITVLVQGDSDVEFDESFTVTLSGAYGGLTIGTATAISTILNDEINIINGDSGDNNLIGTAAVDQISGLAGNDTLNGLGGSDFLFGGAGDDRIYYDALDLAANVNGGDDRDILVVVDGNLPVGFNLAASAFELAEWNRTDTAGQAWNTIQSLHDANWNLLSSTTVNDNGTSSINVYDVPDQYIWSSVRYDYNAASVLTLQVLVLNDQTSIYEEYDITNTQVWSSLRTDYNAALQWTQQVLVLDNGSRVYEEYDVDGDNPNTNDDWSSLRTDYNAALQWTQQVVNYYNGLHVYTQFDPANIYSWSEYRNDYDAAFNLLNSKLVDDSGTYDTVDYDVANTQTWNEWHRSYSAANVLLNEYFV
jgi:trimeric autotransporter adhesin